MWGVCVRPKLTRVEANLAISAVIAHRLDPDRSRAFQWGHFVTALDQYLVPKLVKFADEELGMRHFDRLEASGLILDELTSAGPGALRLWSDAGDLIAALLEIACRTPATFDGPGNPKGWLWRERDRTQERSAYKGQYLLHLDAEEIEIPSGTDEQDLDQVLAYVSASTAHTISRRNLTPSHLAADVARTVTFLTRVWPTDRTHAGTVGADDTRRAAAAEAVPELTREQVNAIDLLCWGSRPHIERTSLFYAHLKDARHQRSFTLTNWPALNASIRTYQHRMFKPVLTLAR